MAAGIIHFKKPAIFPLGGQLLQILEIDIGFPVVFNSLNVPRTDHGHDFFSWSGSYFLRQILITLINQDFF